LRLRVEILTAQNGKVTTFWDVVSR